MSGNGSLADELAAVTRLWAQLRVADRARYLERAAQAVIDEFDDLCRTVAAESQRPCAEIAALELLAAIDALRWLAENARRLLGAHRFALPRALHPLTRASAGHAPVGVIGIRGAGGAPFALPLAAVGAALLAGNGVILAPARGTTIAGQRLAGVLSRAGLPEGLVRVTEDTLEGCAGVLELAAGARGPPPRGGRAAAPGGPRGPDAMLVLADANLPRAIDGALWAACAAGGQLAGSLKRVYVVHELYAEFLEALCRAAGELELGDPLAAHTQLGPLAGEEVAATLEAAIAESVGLGGVVHCGGRRSLAAARGTFFAPAVLSGVPPGARLAHERVPGPVLAVSRVSDSVEAAALANGSERSLGASIWSADRRGAVRIARELEARIVWGNDHEPALPLRQAAADALEQCGRAQLITWEPAATTPPWRFRYDAGTQRAARTVAALHSAREGEREQALRAGAPAIIRLAGRTLWR
jgi:succinate-semialdehyde dehydrogenase/glutarate-semialdehyde dehydrogenase